MAQYISSLTQRRVILGSCRSATAHLYCSQSSLFLHAFCCNLPQWQMCCDTIQRLHWHSNPVVRQSHDCVEHLTVCADRCIPPAIKIFPGARRIICSQPSKVQTLSRSVVGRRSSTCSQSDLCMKREQGHAHGKPRLKYTGKI